MPFNNRFVTRLGFLKFQKIVFQTGQKSLKVTSTPTADVGVAQVAASASQSRLVEFQAPSVSETPDLGCEVRIFENRFRRSGTSKPVHICNSKEVLFTQSVDNETVTRNLPRLESVLNKVENSISTLNRSISLLSQKNVEQCNQVASVLQDAVSMPS